MDKKKREYKSFVVEECWRCLATGEAFPQEIGSQATFAWVTLLL